jgi:hypothetical protein
MGVARRHDVRAPDPCRYPIFASRALRLIDLFQLYSLRPRSLLITDPTDLSGGHFSRGLGRARRHFASPKKVSLIPYSYSSRTTRRGLTKCHRSRRGGRSRDRRHGPVPHRLPISSITFRAPAFFHVELAKLEAFAKQRGLAMAFTKDRRGPRVSRVRGDARGAWQRSDDGAHDVPANAPRSRARSGSTNSAGANHASEIRPGSTRRVHALLLHPLRPVTRGFRPSDPLVNGKLLTSLWWSLPAVAAETGLGGRSGAHCPAAAVSGPLRRDSCASKGA